MRRHHKPVQSPEYNAANVDKSEKISNGKEIAHPEIAFRCIENLESHTNSRIFRVIESLNSFGRVSDE